MAYRYSNLMSAVHDAHSPLREYLDERFPHVRPLQADFRKRSGELLVEGGRADPAMVGTAFDLQVRFLLDPSVPPEIAVLGFAGRPDRVEVVTRVMIRARDAARGGADQETLGRACWALALCTDVYRKGLRRGSAIGRLIDAGRFTPETLMSLAPADALRQLEQLRDVAATALLPHVRRPVHLGPTFDASRLCAADADLITGGVLVDIKTRLGPRNSETGARTDRLTRTDIQQLLGYVLFDTSDAYAIRAIGFYSARYGALVTWPLDDALRTLAGEPVDLRAAREHVWRLLGG